MIAKIESGDGSADSPVVTITVQFRMLPDGPPLPPGICPHCLQNVRNTKRCPCCGREAPG
jgi:predicted amidophosphoribosyltransferase